MESALILPSCGGSVVGPCDWRSSGRVFDSNWRRFKTLAIPSTPLCQHICCRCSLLSGVYAWESKRSHPGGKCLTRVGVKYNWSSTQILQVLVIKYKYKYFAFSPIKYSSTSSTDTPSTSTSVNIGWLIYTGNNRAVIPLKYRPVQW